MTCDDGTQAGGNAPQIVLDNPDLWKSIVLDNKLAWRSVKTGEIISQSGQHISGGASISVTTMPSMQQVQTPSLPEIYASKAVDMSSGVVTSITDPVVSWASWPSPSTALSPAPTSSQVGTPRAPVSVPPSSSGYKYTPISESQGYTSYLSPKQTQSKIAQQTAQDYSPYYVAGAIAIGVSIALFLLMRAKL